MRNVITIDIVPIEEDGVHLFIHGRINGRKARLLIDTGASRSVVDKSRLERFYPKDDLVLDKTDKLSAGLGTNSMESNTITLHTISFGRLITKDYLMVVLDLSHVNESYELMGIKKIDGVIGGDILSRYHAIIDYKNRKLSISR